jgi:ribonuclease R
MVHRLIKIHKSGAKAGKREIKLLEARARSIADSSSEMERKAEQAERDLVDYYKAVYMQRHIGDKFNGVVSGVTGFGMFVELDNTAEGLVRVDSMDGYYIHDKERHALYNRNGAGRYTIGKKVKVKVVSVNVDMGEINMVIDEGRKKRSQSYHKGDSRKKSGRYKKRRR